MTTTEIIQPHPEGEGAGLARLGPAVSLSAAREVFAGALIGKADGTREDYDHSLNKFLAWLQGQGIEYVRDITPADLVSYRAEWQRLLEKGEYKAATVAKKLVPVRRFLLRCVAEGFTALSITKERIETYLVSPTDPKRGRLPTYLETEEIEALLSVITDPRDFALSSLALGSGLRVTELVSLEVSDLQPQPDGTAILEVRQGKGRKARSFKVPAEVFEPVRAYVESTGRSWRNRADLESPIFAITRIRVYQLLREYTRQAQIKKPVTPHVLRHTFATHYVAAGGNPVALAEILGHAGLDYIMTYAHLGRLITGDTYAATWLPAVVQTRLRV